MAAADGTTAWLVRRGQIALAEENFSECVDMLAEHAETPAIAHLLGRH